MGGGLGLLTACSHKIATETTLIAMPEITIGLFPDAGGTYWLTKHLGEARAKALALTAHPLSAEDAAQWGLIWKAVDDYRLMEEATALAEGFAKGPTRAYALTKQAIQAATMNDLDAQLEVERSLQREAGWSDDYKEGVAAFLQKRPADFKGRRSS